MKNDIYIKIMKLCIPEKMANKFNDRFKNTQDRYDYVQDMYLILLEIPEDKLQGLYERKELPDYFSQICLNQITNRKSKFHKTYETYMDKIRINNFNNIDDNEDTDNE